MICVVYVMKFGDIMTLFDKDWLYLNGPGLFTHLSLFLPGVELKHTAIQIPITLS